MNESALSHNRESCDRPAATVMVILLCVFVGGILLFDSLEKSIDRPVVGKQKSRFRRKGYRADIVSAIVNGPLLTAGTKVGATALVTLIPAWRNTFGSWPWLCQFAVFFLVNDFGRYWLHRAYHASNLLWRFHRVHHAVVQMDSLSVMRIHVGEAFIKNFLFSLPFEILGVDPMVIIVYSCWDVLKGFWHHANLRTYIGPLNYFFNSAELHWWHHSVKRCGHRANYGSILSVWDWLFGTAYWPKGTWPDRIGVKGMDNSSETYLQQLASAGLTDAEVVSRHVAQTTAAAETNKAEQVPRRSHPRRPHWMKSPRNDLTSRRKQ